MRILIRWMAPLLGWFAYRCFRSAVLKHSRRKHQLVMKLFRYAADHGSTRALSVYGHLLLFRGEGVENRIQGALYVQQAAQQGDRKAAYQVGKLYEEGFHSFVVNPAKALQFYTQAAEAGHILAVNRLIQVYEHGELGESVSDVQLSHWRRLQKERVLSQ